MGFLPYLSVNELLLETEELRDQDKDVLDGTGLRTPVGWGVSGKLGDASADSTVAS